MSSIKKRYRWMAVIAGACLIPALAACSSGGDNTASGGGTIRFLGHTGLQASMDPVIKAFKEAHPDIDVQVQYSPAGPTYGQTLITQIQGGNAPDVFYGNGGTGATESLIPLAKSGKLLDLSDQPWASGMPKEAADMYQVDGKTYGLVMDAAPHGVLFKPASLNALGLQAPETFADVLKICAAARAQDKYGIALAGQSAGFAAEIVAASIVYSKSPDWNAQKTANKVTFADTPEWQETLKRFQQMRDAECFQPGAESASTPQSFQPMTAGQTLMTIVPSGALGSVAAGSPQDWAMVPFPGDTKEQTRAPIGYQDGLAVAAGTKNKAATLEFLKFVADQGASTRAELSGTVTLADAKNAKMPQSLKGFEPYIANNQTIPRSHDTWAGGGALNTLSTAVVASMTGQASIPDALKTVDAAWGK
ncbi:extracellular solute-binding protein [Paenarthrobacter sp. TYUT067]|uniref:ABC transporter substrate-binding protein n=1 Tax=Paenarthrobacter sp. TYUT067 TaxID=2926245 RepID=UPI00202E0E89|nr:extracellular solute-binding protein [Paenarthrobacter sp. TYUT067]MCM0614988.1 extracellular solute-binding protein [Paenarthrobacter sp. TYUT067]